MSDRELTITNAMEHSDPSDSLSEQFLHAHRLGLVDDIETFCERFPEERERIQREFPQLLDLEMAFRQRNLDKPDIPDKISKYTLGDEIGRGGMGYVHAARHPDLETDLAIKLLPVGRVYQKRNLQRFHAEARACAVMDHANIVPVYDYGLEGEFAYFVMRRIHGRSLAEVVKSQSERRKLNWDQICAIGIQAASALEYAHAHGTIHRDVKPANFMLEESGKIWLSDFGVAKLGEDHSGVRQQLELTMTGELVGTARYMAPERLSGICTPLCDIYGLGLTLYELAAGNRVWANVEEMATLSERPALPDLREINPQVPLALSKIIMKSCTFRPEDRYQSAAEMVYVLQRFSQGNSKADRRTAPNSSRKRRFRKDVLLSSCIAFVLILTSIAAFLNYQVRESSQASAEQIAESLERKLANPLQDGEGKSILESENREIRSAVVDLIKAVAFDEVDIAEEDQQSLSNVLDRVAEDYLESGFDTFVNKQAQHQSQLLSRIPSVLAQIQGSSLGQEWKDYAARLLSLLADEDARGSLGDKNRQIFDRAWEELNEATPSGSEASAASKSALRQFIEDLGEIKLLEDLESLRIQLHGRPSNSEKNSEAKDAQ